MTREEAIKKHRKMWRWLAEHPGKTKRDYLMEFEPEANLSNDCYLCEYADDCGECPLEWPGGSCGGNGWYNKWALAAMYSRDYRDHARAAEIARQIAELPEKEENK